MNDLGEAPACDSLERGGVFQRRSLDRCGVKKIERYGVQEARTKGTDSSGSNRVEFGVILHHGRASPVLANSTRAS